MKPIRKTTGLAAGVLLLLVLSVAFVLPALAQGPTTATGGQAGTTLIASKTASGYWERTFEWTIDKSATPDTWNLFHGDSGTSQYTVSVTKDGSSDKYFVEGEICVNNVGNVPTQDLAIVDEVQYKVGSGQFQTLATVVVDLDDYAALGAGESHCYPYRVYFTPIDGALYRNVAQITITNHSGWLPGSNNCPGPDLCPFGPDPKANFSLPSSPTLIHDSITVNDSNGNSWQFNTSESVKYTKTFTCDADQGQHDNIASIIYNDDSTPGPSDNASVAVNCYALEVTKDASTSLTRTHNWTIAKSADQANVSLPPGQQFVVNYEVTVNTSPTDADWAVSGEIWISNPNPSRDATLTTVSDVVSPDIVANVNCPSLTVPAGGSLHCTYGPVSLPDGSNRTNTATASLQNYNYDSEGNATASGITDFSGSASVDFNNATINEVDDCIDVNDTNVGFLGTVCADEAPKTFTYSMDIGPFSSPDECGDNFVANTASFVTNDRNENGDDSWTVHVFVPCGFGCTLTPGYWKTHSEFGPASYDETWAELPNGASTVFFLSGQTYYEVLWSPPRGNAYYILAHHYIAAKLNILNGALSTPEVDVAMAWAETFFNTHTPSSKLTKIERSQARHYASILDQYNNGYIGPGHCSK
jgi:hypothetical protein